MTPDQPALADLTLPIRVKAKARPRATKQGFIYTPTGKNEQEIAMFIKSEHDGPPVTEDCRVEIDLGCNWFAIRIYPLKDHKRELRGDVDNYAKAILDAAEKAGLIENDKLVRELEICEVSAEWEEEE